MRFCPFCGAENADDVATCVTCARKMPAAVVRRSQTGPDLPPPALPIPPARRSSRPQASEPTPSERTTVDPSPRLRTPSIPPPLPATPPAPAPAPAPAAPTAAPTPAATPAPAASATPAAAAKPVAATAKPAPAAAKPPAELTPTTVAAAPRVADGSKSTHTGRAATESAMATRQIQLPEIEETRKQLPPMPAVPDGGLFDAARYAVLFAWARWRRRKVVAGLGAQVVGETEAFDKVLGDLGRAARVARLEGRALAEENQGIDEAERRRTFAEQACADLTGKKTEENAKFEGVQHDLAARLSDRSSVLAEIASELERLEGQRRGLRDKRKEIEKRQRTLLKQAQEREAGGSREASSALRREAGRLDQDKADLDSRIGGLDKPIGDVSARHDGAKADVDAGKRDLENAREGHRHRLAEIEAEIARRYKELQQAESEIARRLVTLGTIVNLNRVDRPDLAPLYDRADELRGLISAREAEIDRLEAERDGFDRPSVIRGVVVLGAAILLLITLVWLGIRLI